MLASGKCGSLTRNHEHLGHPALVALQSWRVLILFAVMFSCLSSLAQTSVTTYHYDNSRTGQNTNETILTPSNVSHKQFGKIFSRIVDGYVYAQPLYVPKLAIPKKGTHNVVFVATEGDSVYAFDADSNSGPNSGPLWHAKLTDTAHGAAPGAKPVDILGEIRCGAVIPTVGITSTPVIDQGTGTIYVEAFSKERGAFVHRLHALDIATGAEKLPGPVVITAKAPGRGIGSSNGVLTFDPLHQLNRAGLLLADGTIYLTYASHCDKPPAHGWIFAYDATTLTQEAVLVTTPNGWHGGIWMSGAGPAADPDGNVFFASGNGSFDAASVPATELSQSILKVALRRRHLALVDYFTPFNEAALNRHDQDVGSGGVLLLPDQPGNHQHLLVQAGKEGKIYLIDRDQMATDNLHFCGASCTSDPQIVQELPRALDSMFSMPAYWNSTVYFWASGDTLKAFPLRNGLLSATPSSSSKDAYFYPGASISISADGNRNGIIWSLKTEAYASNGPAILRAYDATDLSHLLYSSDRDSSRDNPGGAVKFSVPTVINGRVYVGAAGQLSVYGLLGSISTPSNLSRPRQVRRPSSLVPATRSQ